MSFFLITLCVGLGGLLLMALPALHHRGRAGHGRTGRAAPGAHHRGGVGRGAVVRHAGRGARVAGRVGRVGRGAAAKGPAVRVGGASPAPHPGAGSVARAGKAGAAPPHAHASAAGSSPHGGFVDSVLHYAPEPRVIFTLAALFGAFGNLLDGLTHAPFWLACAGAAVGAALFEWLVVGPVWRLSLRFTGEPSSPLEALVLDRARAVTAFRNGKGIVQVTRDGRALQMAAELEAAEHDVRVAVGDELTIEDVDAARERVIVSSGKA